MGTTSSGIMNTVEIWLILAIAIGALTLGCVAMGIMVNLLSNLISKRIDETNKRIDNLSESLTKQIDKRFDDFSKQIDKRFDDFSKQINKRIDERFGETNRRIDDLGTRLDKRIDDLSIRLDKRIYDLGKLIDTLMATFTAIFGEEIQKIMKQKTGTDS